MFWKLIAFIVSREIVTEWLIVRAQANPYFHLPGYMNRGWIFNPFIEQPNGKELPRWPWLPSIRVHHILRADRERHPHSHPWKFRTFILKGAYGEWRDAEPTPPSNAVHWRRRGDTTSLPFGHVHRIAAVSEGGCWTLFVSFRKQGSWGFLIPWREYDYQGDVR